MSTAPTWYELLGVSTDASAEEIKAAWRDATDKFEPGSGTSQFRLFNEAADILLNPEKRAAYDAELGVSEVPEPPPSEEVSEAPEPPLVEVSEAPEPPPAPVPEAPEAAPQPPVDSALARLGGSLIWVALICAPILVVTLIVTGVSRYGIHFLGVDAQGSVEKVDSVEAGREASAAAERALNSVLSFDYRHMEADRVRAVGFLTPAYAKQFNKTFSLLTTGPDGSVGPAVKTQTVVTAQVLDTGVVDAKPDRVDVLVFVNQNSVKPGKSPAIFQNRVVVTMVRSGSAWLISDLKTY